MINNQICFREKAAERKAIALKGNITESSEDLKEMVRGHLMANIALRNKVDDKKSELEIV